MLCVVCTSVRVYVCVFVVRRARVIELVGHTNHIHITIYTHRISPCALLSPLINLINPILLHPPPIPPKVMRSVERRSMLTAPHTVVQRRMPMIGSGWGGRNCSR